VADQAQVHHRTGWPMPSKAGDPAASKAFVRQRRSSRRKLSKGELFPLHSFGTIERTFASLSA
jgi:hypothetical protein